MRRRHGSFLLVIKLIAALCSISYELVLAQTLSVFLSNTVLRYSVTIGLYMFAMGMGALWVDGRKKKSLYDSFWRLEVVLTFLGMVCLPSVFWVDVLANSGLLFVLWTHALICFIGFLTGQELPLLLSIAREESSASRNSLIAMDYVGAFLGTVLFAFFFYPRAGLISAIWSICLLNALVTFLFSWLWKDEFELKGRQMVWLSLGLVVLAFIGSAFAGVQEQLLVALYLK